MGPFNPETDGFKFTNGFALSAPEAAVLAEWGLDQLIEAITPGIVSGFKQVMSGLSFDVPLFGNVGLPDEVSGQVAGKVVVELAAEIIRLGINPIMNEVGFCGGMVFAGYDFYLQGWPVDVFGTTTPADGTLHDYIFSRLVDSLTLNATEFLQWLAELYVLPDLNEVADIALGAAVGSIGDDVLAGIIGAYLASREHIFHFGGAGSLLAMTKNEWTTLKERLDQQAAWPIGLIFGNTSNPICQHQVLAVNYTDDGLGLGTLKIWNNNSGNCPDVLQLDFRGSELQVSGFDQADQIKGIFVEGYTQKTPPSSLKHGG